MESGLFWREVFLPRLFISCWRQRPGHPRMECRSREHRGEESYTRRKTTFLSLSWRISPLKTTTSVLLGGRLRMWPLNNLVVKEQFHVYISCLLNYRVIKAHRKLSRTVASPGSRLDRNCTVIWTTSSLFDSVLQTRMVLTAMNCR